MKNISASLLNPFTEDHNRYDLFDAVLDNIEEGMQIKLTEKDIAPFDDFLMLGCGFESITITFRRPNDLWWIDFEEDEPMLLEDCPTSFYRTILENIKKGNCTTADIRTA